MTARAGVMGWRMTSPSCCYVFISRSRKPLSCEVDIRQSGAAESRTTTHTHTHTHRDRAGEKTEHHMDKMSAVQLMYLITVITVASFQTGKFFTEKYNTSSNQNAFRN